MKKEELKSELENLAKEELVERIIRLEEDIESKNSCITYLDKKVTRLEKHLEAIKSVVLL